MCLKKLLFNALLLVCAVPLPALVHATYTTELEASSLSQAQSLDNYFSLNYDANIQDSTVNPHASVNGHGDGTIDFFLFTLNYASTVLLDIDNGWSTQDDMDSWVDIYSFSTGTYIAFNDDKGYGVNGANAGDNSVDSGSFAWLVESFDSWLVVSLEAGQYIARVGSYVYDQGGGYWSPEGVSPGYDYTLHVSISRAVSIDDVASAPTSATLLLLLGGIGVMGIGGRQRKVCLH